MLPDDPGCSRLPWAVADPRTGARQEARLGHSSAATAFGPSSRRRPACRASHGPQVVRGTLVNSARAVSARSTTTVLARLQRVVQYLPVAKPRPGPGNAHRAACDETPHRQPYADAVLNEHLHVVASAIGGEVRTSLRRGYERPWRAIVPRTRLNHVRAIARKLAPDWHRHRQVDRKIAGANPLSVCLNGGP